MEKKSIYNIFLTIEPNLMYLTFHGRQILTSVPSMNLMHLSNFDNFWAKTVFSCNVGHWISSPMPWQMHDETNKTSSYNDALTQFHIKVLKIVTLSCFKKSMKLKSYWFGFNLDDLPYKIRASPCNVTCTNYGFWQ